MHKIHTLKNGLTVILVSKPSLESVTTLLAVGTGSRFETQKNNGIAHFLEHMFFKGSRKYPSAEQISTIVDGIGAINNAATSKEWTYYWIKSSAKNLELALDLLSSMSKESLLAEDEIQREKGVIIEEIRMRKDNPTVYVCDLYEMLQYGDQPLGLDTAGTEEIISSLTRSDFLEYLGSLYSPKDMALVIAGKIPEKVERLAEQYFSDLPKSGHHPPVPFKKVKQTKPRVNIYYKETDQANLILGVAGYDRYDKRRYAARMLATILGEGMSSRLFIQVRERRALAYHVSAGHDSYIDAGAFFVYTGLKLEKIEEGLNVILAELDKVKKEKVTVEELKKAKQMIRGRLAISSESTNFLAEYFGIHFVLDHKIETFEQFLEKIDAVTADDVQQIALELIQKNNFNLQIVGPFKDVLPFEKILQQ